MRAVIGLGNLGQKYQYTRHNVGFFVVDRLASYYNLNFLNSKNLRAQVAKDSFFVLSKPNTMMNSSGTSVRLIVSYYKLDAANIYVVHDDLDLKIGEYKIDFGKGPKVHNGLNSIIKSLKTEKFWRVRVGIDNREPGNRTPGELYVLQDFTPAELEIVNATTDELIKRFKTVIKGNFHAKN